MYRVSSVPGAPPIKFCSNLARSWPLKCITKPAQSRPPSVYRNSLNYGFQVWTIIASKCISKIAPSQPRSAFQISLDHGLQVYRQTSSSTASKFARSWPPNCISKLAQSQPRNVFHHGIQVHLWVHSIVIFRRTSNYSPEPPAASPDIPCRWVALLIHTYIDENTNWIHVF